MNTSGAVGSIRVVQPSSSSWALVSLLLLGVRDRRSMSLCAGFSVSSFATASHLISCLTRLTLARLGMRELDANLTQVLIFVSKHEFYKGKWLRVHLTQRCKVDRSGRLRGGVELPLDRQQLVVLLELACGFGSAYITQERPIT